MHPFHMRSTCGHSRRSFLFRIASLALLATGVVVGISACGGGSDSGSSGSPSPDPVANCTGSGSVTISGVVRFERVPVAQDTNDTPYLDFANRFRLPVRRAKVEAVCPDDNTVYSFDVTNDAGEYELTVPENVSVRIRAVAEMNQTVSPEWSVRVVDNTAGGRTWSVSGESFDSETGSAQVNLFAASGWDDSTNSYASSRSAAPFALLDTVYKAMLKVLEADPTASFTPLVVNWSPQNSYGSIGTTYYNSNGEIFVLGDANQDTDEYDEHIVVHEWGHYFEDRFSRSDSIGGSHTSDDRLDIRVAFGEGWGNAWSGMVLADDVYKDTFTGSGFALGLESKEDSSRVPTSAGWFDEGSIQRILYDIYDDTTDAVDGDSDALSMGFKPIYDVMTTRQKNTPLLTNLFPFVYELMLSTGADAALNARLDADDIANVSDAEGSGRRNTGEDLGKPFVADNYLLPLFTPLTVGGTVEICSTDIYTDDASYDGSRYNDNKLGTRRFGTFTSASSSLTITVDGSAHPGSNPAFRLWSQGEFVATGNTDGEVETGTASTTRAPSNEFVLEVWDELNTNSNDSDGGDVCFDVSVEETT